MSTHPLLGASLALLALLPAASAHVVLEQPRATAGSSYRAIFRVGHGCDGLATTSITVRIPAGVQGTKPMPKPGWALRTRSEVLAVPYTSHGKQVNEEVREVSWTAASPETALPDAHYDEFLLRASLPATAGPLWFEVIQRCEAEGARGIKAWTQVPGEGLSTRGLPLPAALLIVEPAGGDHAHH
jgi:periplasmic copper chaperone A